jgi:hypothetical protein
MIITLACVTMRHPRRWTATWGFTGAPRVNAVEGANAQRCILPASPPLENIKVKSECEREFVAAQSVIYCAGAVASAMSNSLTRVEFEARWCVIPTSACKRQW